MMVKVLINVNLGYLAQKPKVEKTTQVAKQESVYKLRKTNIGRL